MQAASRHITNSRRPPGRSAGGSGWVQYGVAAVVSALAFVVYLPALRNGFVQWDDPDYVVNNTHIRALGGALVRWAFADFHASNWHPLTWWSHALDYAVWGLNPAGHHLTNNILHAANTFIVVLLVARLLRRYRNGAAATFLDERRALIAAGVTGVLFGVAPVHVESVAWVAERKDLLCGLFFLLSLLAYVQYAGDRQPEGDRHGGAPRTAAGANWCYLASLGLFACALLSKPMAVSLPAVLLILDWFPFGRLDSIGVRRAALIEKVPFLALSVGSAVVTVAAQQSGAALAMMKVLPVSTRLAVAAKSLVAYLWKMAVPVKLSPYYPYPEDVSLISLDSVVAILLVTGITVLVFGALRRQRMWAAAWSYYVVTLMPVLGLVQVGGQAMADRYTYLPSLGPFLIVGVLAARLSERAGGKTRWATSWTCAASGAAAMAVLLMIYVAISQIGVWKNTFTLWNQVIEKQSVGVAFVYYNRGVACMAMGRSDKALEDFNRAIALDSSDFRAFVDRGFVYGEAGLTEKAVADFDRAIALNPRSYAAFANKGMVYGKAGRFRDAVEQFGNAIDINPESAVAYGNRGLAYSLTGEDDRALDDLSKAVQLDPAYAEAYGARGNLYLKRGDTGRAVADYQQACDLGDRQGCAVLEAHKKQK